MGPSNSLNMSTSIIVIMLTQADKYLDAFFDRFEQIAQQPLLYQTVDDIREGYRRSVCGVDSIYYRIDGKAVEIMAIIGQQDLYDWL
ncbi:MAG: type II toxin-antitoxin system RelE/ParE family toxin [Chromatiaceae bacterium]|nr:type II toxin-antitoxin system RelE/ParE family toxin [Chromatiaceae bacterium]